MTELSTAVVVCSFTDERRDLLLAAVRSLATQTRPPSEVIVVTDHAPALNTWARSSLPGAEVIASTGAPGLSGARNAGVEASSSDIVAFLDDDAAAEPDWLERLTAMYSEPEVQAAGGSVIPAWQGERPGWMPEEFDWVVGCSYRGQPRVRSEVRNLIGCNMSFRRTALEEVGGFAGDLGRSQANRLGCEETELCIRLRTVDSQAVILYEPQARVRHWVPRERSRLSYFLSRCHAEGRSKAEVAGRLGTESALASERAYARRTLPAGVRAGLLACLRGDRAGVARAVAIVLGLVATTLGFSTAFVARVTR